MRRTTRLCSEVGCHQILEDAPAGARCQQHRRNPWDRWRATASADKQDGYDGRWRRFRATVIGQRRLPALRRTRSGSRAAPP
jgi:hypothetical protein